MPNLSKQSRQAFMTWLLPLVLLIGYGVLTDMAPNFWLFVDNLSRLMVLFFPLYCLLCLVAFKSWLWRAVASLALAVVARFVIAYGTPIVQSFLYDLVGLNVSNMNVLFVFTVVAIAVFFVVSCVKTRALKHFFLAGGMTAYVIASTVFHQTQIISATDSAWATMTERVNVLLPYFQDNDVAALEDYCRVLGYECILGEGMPLSQEVTEQIEPFLAQQAAELIANPSLQYRKDIVLNLDNPQSRMHHQIILSQGQRWLYLDDDELAAPYMETARRNFTLLHSLFSVVWLTLLCFVMYRHGRLLDRQIIFSSRKARQVQVGS